MSKKKQRIMTKNLSRLRQLLEHQDGNRTKTGTALGYSPSAVTDWLARGEMPVTADLACECLLRRLGATLKQNEVLVIRAPSAKMEAIITVGTALKSVVFDSLKAETDALIVLHAPVETVQPLGAVVLAMGGKMTKGSTTL